MPYATHAQFYRFGLTRAALARAFDAPFTADAATNVLTSRDHGLADDDSLLLSNAGGALPSPLVAGTTYYVVNATAATFQLAASEGGAAIDLSTAGTGAHAWTPTDPLTPYLEAASRELDRYLTRHSTPLATWTAAESADTCVIAAYMITTSTKMRVPGDPGNVEDVQQRYAVTMAKLEKVAKLNLAMPNLVDATPAVAESAPIGEVDSSNEDRCWGGL